jgi:hypothetical protein
MYKLSKKKKFKLSQTTDNRTYKILLLETAISDAGICIICGWHRGCNLVGKKRKLNPKINWKEKSKKKKQWIM